MIDGHVEVAGEVFAILFLHVVASVTEQAAGFGHLTVGCPLPLGRGIAALVESHSQCVGASFDFFRGFGAVAGIIGIGIFQEIVGMGQFVTCPFLGMSAQTKC